MIKTSYSAPLKGVNLDFDEEGRLTGLEVLGAVERYSSADIFNLSTENLIFEKG